MQPDISNSDEVRCSTPAYTHYFCSLLFIIRASAGRSVYIYTRRGPADRVHCILIHQCTRIRCRFAGNRVPLFYF